MSRSLTQRLIGTDEAGPDEKYSNGFDIFASFVYNTFVEKEGADALSQNAVECQRRKTIWNSWNL